MDTSRPRRAAWAARANLDRDRFELNGRRDDYARLDSGQHTAARTAAGGDVTTRAMAEGAIEGSLADYRMASGFATDFRYSRFDATAAGVRNVSSIAGGVLGARHSFAHPAREH